MGLWHDRVIKAQRERGTTGNISTPGFCSKIITIEDGARVALLSSPYSSIFPQKQSLYSDRNFYVAVDGKIDNVRELASIVTLYQRHGSDALLRIEGAFSLLLYDKQQQTTLIFCSFLTGYPLYFVAKNNLLSVSTNPVYLLHRNDVSDRLDMDEMSLIFTLNSSRWRGRVFSEISEVKHGELITVTPTEIIRKQKTLHDLFAKEKYGSDQEVVEKYQQMMRRAVEKALLSDTKIGIMLSSGMDSSTLAAYASKILHKKKRQLTAYSWTLPTTPQADESEKIKELCSALGIPLILFNGDRYGPFDALDNLLLLPDIPFANPFWFINSEVYRRASAHGAGVLLNGGYADTLFTGSSTLLVDILKDKRFELFLPALQSIVGQSGYKDALRHSPAIRGLLKQILPSWRPQKIRYRAPEWLTGDMKAHREKVEEDIKKSVRQSYTAALSPFQTVRMGIERYLSGRYKVKLIEPHRNPELANYMLGIPTYMTYRDGQMKYFAREAMRGMLPESIRTQPRAGLLNPLVENSYQSNRKKIREMLLDEKDVWRRYIDESWMEETLTKTGSMGSDAMLVIWLSINIQQWQKAIRPGGSLYEGKYANANNR